MASVALILYFYFFLPFSHRGLLGGHSMAVMLKEGGGQMQWYQDELLHMAKDLGLRLLPAFNTSSGLPYPRVRRTLIHLQTVAVLIITCSEIKLNLIVIVI